MPTESQTHSIEAAQAAALLTSAVQQLHSWCCHHEPVAELVALELLSQAVNLQRRVEALDAAMRPEIMP